MSRCTCIPFLATVRARWHFQSNAVSPTNDKPGHVASLREERLSALPILDCCFWDRWPRSSPECHHKQNTLHWAERNRSQEPGEFYQPNPEPSADSGSDGGSSGVSPAAGPEKPGLRQGRPESWQVKPNCWRRQGLEVQCRRPVPPPGREA